MTGAILKAAAGLCNQNVSGGLAAFFLPRRCLIQSPFHSLSWDVTCEQLIILFPSGTRCRMTPQGCVQDVDNAMEVQSGIWI